MEVEIGSAPRGGCGCFGCLSSFFSLGLSLVIGVAVFGMIEASHSSSDEAAIRAVEACSAVTDVLGTPIEESWGAPGCGEYEGGGGHATSNFTIRIHGPKGSGSLSYNAVHHGGPWELNSASVSTSNGTIQAVPCASKSKPDPAPKPGGGRKRGRK